MGLINMWGECHYCGGEPVPFEWVNTGGFISVEAKCDQCERQMKDIYKLEYVKREHLLEEVNGNDEAIQ